MLVLSRNIGEAFVILIGEQQITVKVLECHGGGVRLGIDAPPQMRVYRPESRRYGVGPPLPAEGGPGSLPASEEGEPGCN